jgi:hypothetical protein
MQDITLNLIVLNQQGKPQLILEPKGRAQPFDEMPLPSPNDGTPFDENMHRYPQHIGGATLNQIMKKEHMG